MAVKVKATIGIVVVLLVGALIVSFAGGRRLPTAPAGSASVDTVPVHGTVSDMAGRPIAGATVTARLAKGTMSRFTDRAGRFTFPKLSAGEYDVSATAFGYSTDSYKGEIDAEGGVSLVLTERWDVNKLSTADWLSTTTHEQSLILEIECMSCHTLHTLASSRGLKADHWAHLIKHMGTRFVIPEFTDARMAYVTKTLEEMYGPNAPLPTHDQVKPPPLDERLAEATFWEWKIPTDSFSHSLTVANDVAYFTEFDNVANRMGIFDLKTETFKELPLETPKTGAHTPVVGKDGRIYTALAGKDAINVIDPQTGAMRDIPVPMDAHGSIPTVDPEGNIWWGANRLGPALAKLDPTTEKTETFKIPIPSELTAGSIKNVAKATGEPNPPIRPVVYGIASDLQGKIWWADHWQGAIHRFDPKTGEFKRYEIPGGISNPRGITVDANDVVWFSTYVLHKLGKFDQKTGEMKLYQPPTMHASPYGILASRKTGYVWFADPVGSHITRFDPRTEEFVEYPLPTLDGYARFLGEDSQGRICFTEFMASKIGCLAPGNAKSPVLSTH